MTIHERERHSNSSQTRRFALAHLMFCLIFASSSRLSSAQTTATGSPLLLSESDIEEIVGAHNGFRGSVDPPASNMQALVSRQVHGTASSGVGNRAIYIYRRQSIQLQCHNQYQ